MIPFSYELALLSNFINVPMLKIVSLVDNFDILSNF